MSETAKPTSILRPLVEELAERRERAKLGGGEERIARQHAAEKLTARERIDLLIDPGTFTELGIHAGIHHSVRGLEDKEAPADGVITGYGKVDGRMVAVAAYDFTDMAGSRGMTGEMKVTRLRDLAAATVTEIELRRTTREAVDLAERLEAALRGGKETSA